MTKPSITRNAWVQLYEARRVTAETEVRSPGRPPTPIPRHKVGVTLSQGEVHELEVWQERFSALLRRKVSIGETVGILTRLCSARYTRIKHNQAELSLEALVEAIAGAD
jgi:hypothetical protein